MNNYKIKIRPYFLAFSQRSLLVLHAAATTSTAGIVEALLAGSITAKAF